MLRDCEKKGCQRHIFSTAWLEWGAIFEYTENRETNLVRELTFTGPVFNNEILSRGICFIRLVPSLLVNVKFKVTPLGAPPSRGLVQEGAKRSDLVEHELDSGGGGGVSSTFAVCDYAL